MSDTPAVAALPSLSGRDWTARDIREFMREPSCSGLVLKDRFDDPVGGVLHFSKRRSFRILDVFAPEGEWSRVLAASVGLFGALATERRRKIILDLPDDSAFLRAHLAASRAGFWATGVYGDDIRFVRKLAVQEGIPF